ncbi:MAG: hypothetical protein JWS10_2170 [Cypionkella sp.]|uniref:hypothetical protein n=1 Tax=Cypionkella sp. TaxID=2811411 RepID=UPI00261F5C52|nr:hypothetical protein [Cypionkella sp.]MDB5659555.1 hypothetical protein [Cypionkella sp.]
MVWTFWDFVAFAGSAGVISAIISAIFTLFPARYERTRKARMLAMKTGIQFEAYFRACVDNITSTHNHISSSGHVGEFNLLIPTPPKLAVEDAAWSDIDHALARRAFGFGPWVEYENDGISAGFEDLMGPDDEPDEVRGLSAQYKAALDAYALSVDFFNAYKIKKIEHSESTFEYLKLRKARFDEQVQKDKEAERAFDEANLKQFTPFYSALHPVGTDGQVHPAPPPA